jgi:hypothetical protein
MTGCHVDTDCPASEICLTTPAPAWLLRNDDAGAVGAAQNWWGLDTVAEMNVEGYPSDISTLYDIEDSASFGRIDYRGYRSAAEGAVDLSPAAACGFTSPLSGAVLSGGVGSVFTLRGAAGADTGIDFVDIRIEDAAMAVVQDWTSTVGNAAWFYHWMPSAAGDYTLRCRVTDRSAAQAEASTVVTVEVGITTSGPLPADETWMADRNGDMVPDPVVLTGDVTVPAGVTLTIEAGTEIRGLPVASS